MNMEPIYKGNVIQFAKLLTATWQLYRTHFIPILVLSVIGSLPSLYIRCFVPGIPSPIFTFVSAVIGVILGLLSYMSLMYIVDDAAAGRATSIVIALRKALTRIPIVITTGLLSTIRLFGWFLLLFVPGIIKSVRYSFTLQAVALRNVAHSEAIRYSIRMVENFWWTVVFAGFFIGLPGLILSLPFVLKGPDVLANVHGLAWGMVAVQILTTGFYFVGETLLFLAIERIKIITTEVSATSHADPKPAPEE